MTAGYTYEFLEALARGYEKEIPVVLIGEFGTGATLIVRQLARLRAPLRAPHHTISAKGLVEEAALATDGVLFLDDYNSFSTRSRDALRTWFMRADNSTRPLLILRVHTMKDVCVVQEQFARAVFFDLVGRVKGRYLLKKYYEVKRWLIGHLWLS